MRHLIVCLLPRVHVGVRHVSERPSPEGGSVISATEIGLSTEMKLMPRMLFAGSETATVYLPGTKSKGTMVSMGLRLAAPASEVRRCTVFPRDVSTPSAFFRRTFTLGMCPTVSQDTTSLSPATTQPSSDGCTHRRGCTFSTSYLVSSGLTVAATGSVLISIPDCSARRCSSSALARVTNRVALASRSLSAAVSWMSSSAMCRPTSRMAMPVIAPAAEDRACRELSAAPRTPSFSISFTFRLRRS
mmetsp:Transcript_45407/g.107684  ORF Transcript_45407/g.107684 Transcript_45407/m.107684 type:complete len:245 (+) Transcript_45407:118-852(+)